MNDIEIRREKLVKLFKWGGLAAVVALVVPFLFGLALMALGTVAAGTVAALGGIAILNFLPVFSMKMANWRLKAMKAEARANPIETAQNEIFEMSKELDAFKEQTKSRMSQGNAMIADVAEMMKTDPEGAAAFQPDIQNFHIEMTHREERLTTMITTLEEARVKVDRAAKRWALAQKHAAIRTPSEADKQLRKILLDEAFDTVMVAAHKNAADMTVENMAARVNKDIQNRKTPGAIPAPPLALENLQPYTIDAGILDVSGKEKVSA